MDDVMLFRIDRIKNVLETKEHFETPQNFNLRKHEPFAAYC
jgi:hypothetical protein